MSRIAERREVLQALGMGVKKKLGADRMLLSIARMKGMQIHGRFAICSHGCITLLMIWSAPAGTLQKPR